MKTKRLTPKQKGCLVRGNKVFFYGDLANKVERAISISGMTPEKWLNQAIKSYMKYLKISK